MPVRVHGTSDSKANLTKISDEAIDIIKAALARVNHSLADSLSPTAQGMSSTKGFVHAATDDWNHAFVGPTLDAAGLDAAWSLDKPVNSSRCDFLQRRQALAPGVRCETISPTGASDSTCDQSYQVLETQQGLLPVEEARAGSTGDAYGLPCYVTHYYDASTVIFGGINVCTAGSQVLPICRPTPPSIAPPDPSLAPPVTPTATLPSLAPALTLATTPSSTELLASYVWMVLLGGVVLLLILAATVFSLRKRLANSRAVRDRAEFEVRMLTHRVTSIDAPGGCPSLASHEPGSDCHGSVSHGDSPSPQHRSHNPLSSPPVSLPPGPPSSSNSEPTQPPVSLPPAQLLCTQPVVWLPPAQPLWAVSAAMSWTVSAAMWQPITTCRKMGWHVEDPSAPPVPRHHLTAEAKAVLEAAFERNPTPSTQMRRELADNPIVNGTMQQVARWFQNRRLRPRISERAASVPPRDSDDAVELNGLAAGAAAAAAAPPAAALRGVRPCPPIPPAAMQVASPSVPPPSTLLSDSIRGIDDLSTEDLAFFSAAPDPDSMDPTLWDASDSADVSDSATSATGLAPDASQQRTRRDNKRTISELEESKTSIHLCR